MLSVLSGQGAWKLTFSQIFHGESKGRTESYGRASVGTWGHLTPSQVTSPQCTMPAGVKGLGTDLFPKTNQIQTNQNSDVVVLSYV